METFTTILDAILKAAQAVAVIYAAAKVARGVEAWRSEYIGKRRTDLAEEVLVKFYALRDAIQAARPATEEQGRITDIVGERQRATLAADLFIKRRDREVTQLLHELNSLKPRFLAHFPKTGQTPFIELKEAYDVVNDAAGRIYVNTPLGSYDNHLPDDRLFSYEAVLYKDKDDGDEVSVRLADAEGSFMDALRPHMAEPLKLRKMIRQGWRGFKEFIGPS